VRANVPILAKILARELAMIHVKELAWKIA
jgi:hypothetical protein